MCDETEPVPTRLASLERRADAVKVLQGCGRGDLAFGSGWIRAFPDTERGGLREGYMSS